MTTPPRAEADLLTALAAGPPDAPAVDLTALADAVAVRAWQQGQVDVAVAGVGSPIGPLLLAATPAGLVRVAFAQEDTDAVLAELSARIGPRVVESGTLLDEPARQLAEYFDRRRRDFDLALDLRLATRFRAGVLTALRRVGYGTTTSYAALAAAAGRPAAVRAVGSACATNPLPVVVPCHRVLRSDGGLGGYAGGLAAKRLLLATEAA